MAAIFSVLLWVPLVTAAVLAGVSWVLRTRPWTLWLPVIAAAVLLLTGIVLLVATGGQRGAVASGTLLRADALSAWLLTVVGAVAVVALAGGVPAKVNRPRSVGSLSTLLCLFLGAMSLAVLADSLGILWVAVEATTITTAFLVGFRGGRRPLEAAWKYVILGSVGVAIAFLGVVLLLASARSIGEPTLSWIGLLEHASALDPKLAVAGGSLAALGFATKAGLAPMHSWLPDAHSQAPAPVSALMSGVLLSVAFYAVLRVQAIVDAAAGPGTLRPLLLTAGLLSLAVAAALTLTQRDYKRLLAYSSIEHMGLMALGAAAGSDLAIAAVLLHMLGHGLVKSSMFVIAGRVLRLTGTTQISEVRNLLRTRPDLGVPFLLGGAALVGFPPFVTFVTEVAIVVSGFAAGLTWQLGLACALLLVVFAGLVRPVLEMTLGADPDQAPLTGRDIPAAARTAPVAVALGVSALATFAAWPLSGLLMRAVAALGGAG